APPGPSPATRMREPVSTPAGIFTSRWRLPFAQPVPRHVVQGFRFTWPEPPQVGHGSSTSREIARPPPPQASPHAAPPAGPAPPPAARPPPPPPPPPPQPPAAPGGGSAGPPRPPPPPRQYRRRSSGRSPRSRRHRR